MSFAQEDKPYELESVQFHGNFTLPTSELQTIVDAQESPGWFSQFLYDLSSGSFGEDPIYFDSLVIPGDLKALKKYYWAHGYFESRFYRSYYFDTTDHKATIVYHIEEWTQFKFGKYQIIGLEMIAPSFQETLKDIVTIDSSEYFSELLVEENRNEILKFLKDHGYMLIKSEILPIQIDTLNNRADLTMIFNTGERYKVSDVRVIRTGEGKDLVGDVLLEEIVSIEIDSWYSHFDLLRGQTRLYRTNLFSSALVSGITADTNGNQVPIMISTDVSLLHELSPKIIMNNEDDAFNLGLGINFSKKNFLGDARKVTLSASAAAQNITDFLSSPSLSDTNIFGYADVRLNFNQPFLFGRPISTTLENYFTLQKRKAEYNARIIGAKFSLNFEMPQYTYLTSLSTYLSWENSRYIYQDRYIEQNLVKYFKITYPGLPNEEISDSVDNLLTNVINDNSIESANSFLGVEFAADHTNNFLFPTRGYSIGIILEEGNFIGSIISRLLGSEFTNPRYAKAIIHSTFYLPVYSSNTSAFGVKFKIGNIFTYKGDKAAIPLNQRLYAGGSNSVRGWTSRELVPREQTFDISASSSDLEAVILRGVTPGGYFLIEGSIESRNRIGGNFGGAIFVDFGNTWNNYKEFQIEDLAVAAGFGLRYYTDFAPIRVDFGFKAYNPLDKRSFFNRISSSGFWSSALWNQMEIQIGIGEAF